MTVAPAAPPTGPAARSATPLAATYMRLVAHCETLRVSLTPPGTTTPQLGPTVTDLATSPPRLAAFVEAESARIRTRHDHTPRPHVAASRALHDYLWSVCLLMGGAWHLDRRVPRVHPDDVQIDLATGVLHITPGTFACLPDDPAAGLPGTRVLADEEDLRTELRTAVADHVGPLLTAIAPQLRRGPRALWGMVGDDLVSAIWYLGRMLGEEEEALRATEALLPGPLAPFPAGAAFRHLTTRDGTQHPTRTRLGCCLYYTIRPTEACITCPRTCDKERLRRLEGDPGPAPLPLP
ncbi:(2Fe-2S)-binding protein [Streptomyces sp. NPDC057136]|uniref:(2Fe-2S)-binding protein n=1 Tax=Streptomyces sp. NPDC057136 TaxID=3346029 RepID=UPI0036270AAD